MKNYLIHMLSLSVILIHLERENIVILLRISALKMCL